MPENKKKRAPIKEIFGWAMFDFANSSYTTVIITVVYAVVFPRLIVGDAPDFKLGNFLWSLALGISYILVVISVPLLGAMMDFKASKKKYLFRSYVLTIIATSALFFVAPGYYILGIAIIIISNFGFAIGESFVSSFLPDLGPQEDLGKISGYAWGLGYFGGLASTVIVMFGLVNGDYSAANFSAIRFIGPVTAAFFLISGIPTFLLLKERGIPKALPQGENLFTIGFHRLGKTFREIKKFRDLVIFLISIFFTMAGLSIVISFAFIYGDQVIKWQPLTQTIMFVVTQLTAAGGAILFGIIQDRIGAKKTFNLTLLLWIVAIILIWGAIDITSFLNNLFNTSWKTEYVFVAIGSLAGIGLGATQSAGRALVGIFSPDSKSGEFFGFWGLSGKLASAIGLISLGLLQATLGLHNAILICSAFFLIALIFSISVNEEKGKKTAIEYKVD